MEKVLAHLHATKCYESYKYILISYHHKRLHLCVVSSQWLSYRTMIFFRRQHVLRHFKLIFHRLIVLVYLRYTRHNTRRLRWWTFPQRHNSAVLWLHAQNGAAENTRVVPPKYWLDLNQMSHHKHTLSVIPSLSKKGQFWTYTFRMRYATHVRRVGSK
jgi:hypothetical protein